MLVNRPLAVVLACAGIVWVLTASLLVLVMAGCFVTDCPVRANQVAAIVVQAVLAALGGASLLPVLGILWQDQSSVERGKAGAKLAITALLLLLWIAACFLPGGLWGTMPW
jgi:hypothetical protein